jgi:T5orf172 domain
MALGYIYVLSNPAMGSLLKIGFTCASVEQRAYELSSATAVPSAFGVEYFHLTEDIEEVEALDHAALPRHNENREFFRRVADRSHCNYSTPRQGTATAVPQTH